MGSQYYRNDSVLGAVSDFQTTTTFNPPAGVNQPPKGPPRSFPPKASKKVVKTPPVKKRPIVQGKTPAQIINELYQGVTDTYDNDGMMSKCTLTVAGQVFHAVASGKKNAKHEACLVALKSLRPDVAAEIDSPVVPNINFSSTQFDTPLTKKMKVDSLDSCCSLKDLLSKLCLEGNKKYKMDTTDVTVAGGEKGDVKLRKFSTVLSFDDEGKMYTHTAEGSSVANTMVIRQALKDVFKVSESEIIKVIKRGQLKKLHNMQSFSALNMMCTTSLYSISSVDFEDVPEGKSNQFICYITIKNCDGVEVQTKGPKSKSKGQAKERAAALTLTELFQIHPASLEAAAEGEHPTTAVSQLFEMGSRQKPALRPEFTDIGEEMNGTVKYFKFKCTVGDREFMGSGKSKKDAKNESANIALNNIFHMNVPTVRKGGEEKCEDGGEGGSNIYDATCAYVRSQYEQMCNFYGMNSSSDFTCFVLLNENNEKKLISIGSSPQNISPFEMVAESGGKTIIHHDSVIYARRAAIRFFIDQLAKAEAGQESCLEPVGDMFRLKPTLRLSIVTSNPIDIRFSAPESTVKRLSVYGQCNLLESVVDEKKEEPRVHCVADKIFKWCHLGVQGSLLTNRINPIIPTSILTMTKCPLSDVSYVHSFTSRICAPPFPIAVHSSKMNIDASPSPAHLWSRAVSKLEKMSHYTGLTSEATESSCSKYQLYKAFLEATPRFPKGISYQEAKNMAGGYVSSKGLFYHEMTKAGLGRWNGVRALGDRFVIE